MSQYNQQQVPVAYPPPGTAYPPPQQGPYVSPPPPVGYPTKGAPTDTQHIPPGQTTSRGEGFWKGCCAALCCCWVLDFCCC